MNERLTKETLMQYIDRVMEKLAPLFLAMVASQTGTVLPSEKRK